MGVIVHIKNKKPVFTGDLIEGIFSYPTYECMQERMKEYSQSLRFAIVDKDDIPVSFSFDNFEDLECNVVGYKKFIGETAIIWKRLRME